MKTRSLLAFALLILFVAPARSENWPHWRGPDRNGTAVGRAPLTWSAEENVVWKTALPELSGATPIIWGDRIYLNVADGTELELWALDRAGCLNGRPVVLLGSGWQPLVDLLRRNEMLESSQLRNTHVTENPAEAVRVLGEALAGKTEK